MSIKYGVNKKTGVTHDFSAGTALDKERSKSKDWKTFNDPSKASEYARKIKKH